MTIEVVVNPRAASAIALRSIVFSATTCVVCALADTQAQTQVNEPVLHAFVGGADGANPEAPTSLGFEKAAPYRAAFSCSPIPTIDADVSF